MSLHDGWPGRDGMRGPGAVAWLSVLAIHGAVLWSLLGDVAGHGPRNEPASLPQRVTLRLIPWSAPQRAAPALPLQAADPPVPKQAAPRRRTPDAGGAPALTTAESQRNGTSVAPLDAVSAADAAASAPVALPSLLETDATRRAIRASARTPGLADRTAAVSEEPRPVSAQERLANDVKAAGKGDCVKGDYAGAGMGILSLPFLAVAVARGDCAQ